MDIPGRILALQYFAEHLRTSPIGLSLRHANLVRDDIDWLPDFIDRVTRADPINELHLAKAEQDVLFALALLHAGERSHRADSSACAARRRRPAYDAQTARLTPLFDEAYTALAASGGKVSRARFRRKVEYLTSAQPDLFDLVTEGRVRAYLKDKA